MLIIPAIDLKEGKCVRLSQGKMNESTIYSDSPAETAARWEAHGARRLHIVDLDGAVSGVPQNMAVIKQIRSAVKMEIELGGGIRDLETAAAYLSAGIDYIILGTAAIRNPELLKQCCEKHSGKIIIGIDARDGNISVRGWTEDTRTRAIDFAKTLDAKKVSAIIFTDISRDGMLTGPNIKSTVSLAEQIDIPVVASGGISGMKDIAALKKVEDSGIFAVIVGRALYTGDINLAQCIKAAEKTTSC